MAGNYTRRITLYINGKYVRNEVKSINAEMVKLTNTIKTMEIGSREYTQTMAKIKHLRSIIDQHNAGLRNTQLNLTTLKGLANAFNKYWPVIMGSIGAILGISSSASRATEKFTEFDDKIADVMKVTNMTREEVIELNEELKKIDTRTAQNDLLDLAYVAGKLGKRGKDDVLGFVKAADKISVALSKELGGNAEEAVRAIGKAVEIFELDKIYGIEEALLRVGSAVNTLGMSSTAQEGFLISFLQRVAGIAPMAGVGIDKILGLAGALDRFGQKSEVSATAYSKLMSKMATETEAMAKIMGLSIDEYVNRFTKDANETMLQLFESLGGEGTASFTQLVQLLGESDLEGQRMTQVMGTMVNKVKEIREQMNLASQAMRENTSITNEFNIKNNNGAAIAEKKKKKIEALRVEMGERLMPVYLHGLSVQERFIKILTILIEFIYQHRRAIAGLVAYMVIYKTVSSGILAIQKISLVTTGLLRWAVLRTQMAYFLYTNQIRKAAMAHAALKAVQMTNPWIMAASVIMGVVAAISAFTYRVKDTYSEILSLNEEFTRIQKEKAEEVLKERTEVNLLVQQINILNESGTLRNKLVSELIQKYPELLKGLDDEKLRLGSIQQILAAINREYDTKLKVVAIESQIEARKQQIIKNNVEMLEIEQNMQAMREGKSPYAPALISQMEQTYQRLNDLNKKYIKEIEKLTENAKTVRVKSIMDEIETQKGILQKLIVNPLNLIRSQLEDAKARGDKAEIDRLQTMVNLLTERKNVTEQLIANLESQLAGAQLAAGIETGGGSGNKKSDFSEDAEAAERIRAKEKYKKGIIKTEIDLQDELDKIELKYLKGRLSQLDIKSEDYIKLKEAIVDKELEIARKKQDRLDAIENAGLEFSPVQKAEKAYNEELKKLNLFFKKQADMTTQELLAYQALQKKHQLELNKLDADAIKKHIDDRQAGYETNLSNMRFAHVKELESITSFADAMAYLRKYYSEEEVKDIKTLNQAKIKVQQHQQSVEADLMANHLDELMSQMNQFMEDGSWDGLSLADSVMSPEEWEVLKTVLNELIEKLQKLRKEREESSGSSNKDDEKDIKLRGSYRTDILGFTMDDWEKFFENLKKGEQGIEDLEMAAYALGNAWAQINQLRKNAEDREMQEYEANVEKKKELLEYQLEHGIISQEVYNKKVKELDASVDKGRAYYAYEQAKRDRNVALFQAVINTAAGIIEAIPNIPLMILAAAAGAVQTAVIASTPLPSIPGREKGGFFDVLRAQDKKKFSALFSPGKRGYINRPTVLVGENRPEYVVPGDALANPTIRPILDVFEMARLNNNLKTIDMRSIIPSIPGRASGGYISGTSPTRPTGPTSPTGISTDPTLKELHSLLKSLNLRLNKPIDAIVKYQHITDMDEKVESIESQSQL